MPPQGHVQNEQVPRAQRNRRNYVVVAYDIPDDRRRHKVMKTLEGYGTRAQYSVFECELRPKQLEELKVRLRRLVDKEADDLRFYPLCDACLRKVTPLGKSKVMRRQPYVVVGE